MSFKLLVVFAMISLAAATSRDEDLELYEKQVYLESKVVSKEIPVEPETMKNIVVELVEKIYPKRPATEYTENRARMIVTALYSFSLLDKKICDELEDYNGATKILIDKVSHMPNVVRMMQHYKEEQNKMCK